MEFSDKFTKSLAATLVQYKNAPIKLKDELVKMFYQTAGSHNTLI